MFFILVSASSNLAVSSSIFFSKRMDLNFSDMNFSTWIIEISLWHLRRWWTGSFQLSTQHSSSLIFLVWPLS